MPYCCAAASQEAVQVRRDAETAPAACAICSQQLSGSLQARQASEEQQPLDIGPSQPLDIRINIAPAATWQKKLFLFFPHRTSSQTEVLAAHNFYFTNEVTEPQHCYMLIGLRLTANRLSEANRLAEGRRSRAFLSNFVY